MNYIQYTGEYKMCDNIKRSKFEPIRLSGKIGVLQGYDFTEESKILMMMHRIMKELQVSIDLKAMEFCIKHFRTCSTSFPNEFGIRVDNRTETIQCNICNEEEILFNKVDIIIK